MTEPAETGQPTTATLARTLARAEAHRALGRFRKDIAERLLGWWRRPPSGRTPLGPPSAGWLSI